ncbi:MAG TPA: CopG family transcriptional regulator [Thermoanaerobaculia bacterium]|jgi:hypothetical protein
MKTLELHLPDDVATRLERAAREQGVSLEELIRRSVDEKLARDAEFASAADYVLAKNSDLYERLS